MTRYLIHTTLFPSNLSVVDNRMYILWKHPKRSIIILSVAHIGVCNIPNVISQYAFQNQLQFATFSGGNVMRLLPGHNATDVLWWSVSFPVREGVTSTQFDVVLL